MYGSHEDHFLRNRCALPWVVVHKQGRRDRWQLQPRRAAGPDESLPAVQKFQASDAPLSSVPAYAGQLSGKDADTQGITVMDQCMAEQKYVRDSVTRSLIYNQVWRWQADGHACDAGCVLRFREQRYGSVVSHARTCV